MKTTKKEQEKGPDGPRILFLDIETAPDVAYVWGVYQENAIAIHEHWYVLSYAYRWRGEKRIICRGLDDFPGYKGGNSTERKLIAEVRDLLDQADIVVAHNGADFDVRKLNARMIDLKFTPPSPYKVVDTKRDLTKVAKFSSNRLNWLGKQLGIGQKTMEHHDWAMWSGCMKGDKKCWSEMKVYNTHDIELLEQLYDRLAPWIPQPNAQLWASGKPRCVNPACSSRVMNGNGTYPAASRIYQRYLCPSCGASARSVKSTGGVTMTPTPRKYS